MLELGTGSDAHAADLIIDGTDASFIQDVVEASKDTPIIVDFWAPWCGPCKTLGPALEAEVTAAGGRVKMVKVNVDENPQVSQQLRIQSIPTVYAFVDGQPVDGFQGALPPSEIKTFVDKIVALAPEADGGLADAVAAAQEMLDEGNAADALETFNAIIEEDASMAAAYAGIVAAHIALEDLEQAEAVINGVPMDIATAPEIEAAHAQIELARQAAQAGPVAELRAKVEANPDDPQARLDFATALHASGSVEEAVEELLDLFKRDRDWKDGAAKAQLFTIFDALKADDPIVLNGRRKLTSLIFM